MTAALPIRPEEGAASLTLLAPPTSPLGLPVDALRSRGAGHIRHRRLGLLVTIDAVTALALCVALVPLGLLRSTSSSVLDVAVALLWVTLLATTRSYEDRAVTFGLDGARQVVRAGVALAAAGLVLSAIAGTKLSSRPILELTAGVVAVAVGQRWLVERPALSRQIRGGVRVVVAGHRRDVDRVLGELRSARRFEPVGVCLTGRSGEYDLPTLRGLDNLATAVSRHAADAVIVVPCRHLDPVRLRRVAWDLEQGGTQLLVAPGLLDVARTRTSIGLAGTLPLLHVRHAELCGGRRLVKHVGERALACLALLLLAPILLGIALAVRRGSSGSALYRQTRVGKDGVPFSMLKFRTMSTDADARRSALQSQVPDGTLLFKMRDDPRVTREGRLLRRYSLDELPQLLNVVRGEMSLVGPRPPLPTEVAQYEPDAYRRLAVTPGLTGLWQVSGRSDLSWEESLRLDLRYVDNWSLGLDLHIVVRTARAVLGHRGAY